MFLQISCNRLPPQASTTVSALWESNQRLSASKAGVLIPTLRNIFFWQGVGLVSHLKLLLRAPVWLGAALAIGINVSVNSHDRNKLSVIFIIYQYYIYFICV